MNSIGTEAKPGESLYPRSHRLVRRLSLFYAAALAATGAVLLAGFLPAGSATPLRTLAREAAVGGLAGLVLAALLLSLTGLLATLALTAARFRYSSAAQTGTSLRWRDALRHPGVAARVGQAIIVTAGALLIFLLTRLLWPTTSSTDATSANIAGAFVLALAFASLVCERVLHAFPAPQLPEAPTLRRLLLLTTLLLAAAAVIEFARGAMIGWLYWPQRVITCLPALIVLELALRALARLFLPAPSVANATAVTDSLLAGLLTGGPRSPATLLRTHLGLDFARSWALSFLGAAILPAVFGTALLCWALTGLKLIDLGQRGIYERLGAPVAVLSPGLHLIMPWPLGRLRMVEFGAIHSVAIGVDETVPQSDTHVAAEAVPPASLNRRWESSHPGQAEYLVPSPGTGQGFQSVSTEIRVLYRVGLTDAAALQSVYTIADPQALIRFAGSRLVLRYFNSRTLDAVLGAQRENVASSLQDALTADLNSHQAGIEIVSVLIEEIHPPAGAAAAYHAVQAAEINASASISDERGRASRVSGVAQQEAHQLLVGATARATEDIDAANAAAYRFNAERHAHDEGGRAFLLERSISRLQSALTDKPLLIIDHRLSPAEVPILDLRQREKTGSVAPIDGTDAVLELGAAPASGNR